jgi:hypothetical protein
MTGPDHYVTAESFADAAAQAQLRDDPWLDATGVVDEL